MRIAIWIIVGSIFIFGLSACAPVSNDLGNTAQLKTTFINSGYQSANVFFLDTEESRNLDEFAKDLQSLIASANTQPHLSTFTQQSDYESAITSIDSLTLLDSAISSKALPAKVDLLEKQIKLFWAHQLGFFGELFLSETDKALMEAKPTFNNYVESLRELNKHYPALQLGKTQLYEVDSKLKLLAHSRRYRNMRAFIAFNLSFDTHEMPLPFGFMSSTKVVMWRSDDINIREFVTNSAITIQPYTSVIVIVGA